MDIDLRPSRGTTNRLRLIYILFKGGTRVLQSMMVDLLLQYFLKKKKETIMCQIGFCISLGQLELLYPIIGHPPTMSTLPEEILSVIINDVLSIQEEPGFKTKSELLASIDEYLCTEGFRTYLARKRNKFTQNVKLRRSQWDILYCSSNPVTVKNLDITLLSFILVHTFKCKPTSGIWSEMPLPENVSIGDDVLRLRFIRNTLLHQPSCEINDDQFYDFSLKIFNVFLRHGLVRYSEFEALNKVNLDPDMNRHYLEVLEHWRMEEMEVKETLTILTKTLITEVKDTKKLIEEKAIKTDNIVQDSFKQSKELVKQFDEFKYVSFEEHKEKIALLTKKIDNLEHKVPSTTFYEDTEKQTYERKPYQNGFHVIINFNDKRKGSYLDVAKLQSFYEEILKWKVEVQQDLTQLQMKEYLQGLQKSFSDERFADQYHCFFMTLMSHGIENGIQMSDGSYVILGDIIDCFKSDMLPTFSGKPKMFLIQACREKTEKQLVHLSDDEPVVDYIAEHSTSLPADSDIHIAYATTPGNKSFRSFNDYKGAWFLNEILEVFDKYHRKEHVEEMLIRVRNNLAQDFKYVKNIKTPQMSCSWTTFRKRLYLSDIKESLHS